MAAQKAVSHEKDEKIPPRDRILAAAGELFYRHGIRAVGVEAIAEAAGTNKMTLYRHFSSKDELVAEYLRQSAKAADACWDQLEQLHPGDELANGAWFRGGDHVADSDQRGCALTNAAVELPEKMSGPPRDREYKSAVRSRLVRLARQPVCANRTCSRRAVPASRRRASASGDTDGLIPGSRAWAADGGPRA